MHITQGDYEGKSVIVSWVTPDKPGSSEVRYGLSKGKYDFTAKGSFTNYTFYTYKSGYIHKCFLNGLQVIKTLRFIVSRKESQCHLFV